MTMKLLLRCGRRQIPGLLICGVVWLLLGTAAAQSAEPRQPSDIMPLDQVRVGMQGYGLTVFHGDRIEPFACHVVSVVSDSSAKRATIWIECTDPRMQRSGPVQGMSGSPIYLWDDDSAQTDAVPRTPGEGGRLIGAFAFGYADVNVCLVGVQPIEYMREVGERAISEPLDQPLARRFDRRLGQQQARQLNSLALQATVHPAQRQQVAAVGQLVYPRLTGPPGPDTASPSVGPVVSSPLPSSAGIEPARISAMKLPLTVGDAETARLLSPLLAPSGIQVMAGDLTNVAGQPPSNVDPGRVKLEPGSVLSIPLAYGDVDFNAAGTVTDVLPDGTVLGFGHAMDAIGSSRLPMANGYTHFVVSRSSISFKRGSSLDIVGSIVRDEASAVAGVPDTAFFAAPVSVEVNLPRQPARQYQYQVVDDPQITPAILAAVTNASLTAVQGPPVFHTIHLRAKLTFSGGQTLQYDRVIPGSGMNGLIFELLPGVNALMQNPFDPLRLDAAEVTLDVVDGIDQAELVAATLDRPLARPGETLHVTLRLEPYDEPEQTLTLPFTLPTQLPDGEYQMMIGDYGSHINRLVSSDPTFQDVVDIQQLADALQKINDAREKAIYLAMIRPQPGVTVGRQAFDHLPSSRASLLTSTPTSMMALRPIFVEQVHPADHVVVGDVSVGFTVQQDQP